MFHACMFPFLGFEAIVHEIHMHVHVFANGPWIHHDFRRIGSIALAFEVLKLLNELLPAIGRDLNVPLNMEKEAFLESRPDLLQKFGMDLLPILIQVGSLICSF